MFITTDKLLCFLLFLMLFLNGFACSRDYSQFKVGPLLDTLLSSSKQQTQTEPAASLITVTYNQAPFTAESLLTTTFQISLAKAPAADVIIGPIVSLDTTEGSVTVPAAPGNYFTFTPLNWNVPQTVTVQGVADDGDTTDTVYQVSTGSTTSTDQTFHNLTPVTATLKNIGLKSPADYTIVASTASFQDIATTGTEIIFGGLDDSYALVPIGFTFNFGGDTNYTDINVSTNGHICNSPTVTSCIALSNPDLFTIAEPYVLIAPWMDDLILYDNISPNVMPPSKVYYVTTGSAPNRTFVVQWTGVYRFTDDEQYTFQAILTENSNTIEFRYGPKATALLGNGSLTTSASAGIKIVRAGVAYFKDAIDGSTTYTPGVNDNRDHNTFPSSGTSILFTPPP